MKATIFPVTLVRDGEHVSADFTFTPGKNRGKVRLWNPTTDATLHVDELNVVSDKQRARTVAGLPVECLTSQPYIVGAPGFEPGTSCSQSRRATGLRHAPLDYPSAYASPFRRFALTP